MSDQLVAEAATYAAHNKHKRRTFMVSERFEPIISAIKRLMNYASDHTATGICSIHADISHLETESGSFDDK
jgi:hypothetical protein